MTDFKWLFVGDLQIPFHDPRAVALVMKVAKKWKPDAVDFVGDIDDQLEYSTFSDGTTDEFFNLLAKNKKENEKDLSTAEARALVLREENPLPMVEANAKGARDFYHDMRKILPKADMHSSLGNHDIRVFKYLDKKAPDYADQATPEMLWGLDSEGITWRHYDLPPFERFGRIHVHHGATVTDTGLAVRGDIEKYNVSLVRGHDHRGGVVYKSYPMTGGSLAGMGTGHLCIPSKMTYTVNPSWELGFGLAHVIDGKAHLQFIPIRDYKCVVDGTVFEG